MYPGLKECHGFNSDLSHWTQVALFFSQEDKNYSRCPCKTQNNAKINTWGNRTDKNLMPLERVARWWLSRSHPLMVIRLANPVTVLVIKLKKKKKIDTFLINNTKKRLTNPLTTIFYVSQGSSQANKKQIPSGIVPIKSMP